MSPVSTATSVPAPMAMPRSACASAGASLTPSPTIAVNLPSAWSCLTPSALSSGSTSAKTRSMPTCFATASAVRRLSPVIITGSMPSALRSAMACAAFGRTVSAAAMTPAAWPSIGDQHQRLALAESRRSTAVCKRPERDAVALEQAPRADQHLRGRQPWRGRRDPARFSNSSTGQIVGEAAALEFVEHGLGQRVAAARLSGAGQAQQLVLGDALRRRRRSRAACPRSACRSCRR